MRPPRLYRTEAVIIRRIDLGEADRIVTVYSPTLGKIRAVAKGVRRPSSRLGGHLELCTQAQLLLAKGQNLDVITQSQAINSFLPLHDDPDRAHASLYLCELIDRFTDEGIANQGAYKLLVDTLHWLSRSQHVPLVLRSFELRLLAHMGFEPSLYWCVRCQAELRPVPNFFSASQGGAVCPSCALNEFDARPLPVDTLKVLRFLLSPDAERAEKLRVAPDIQNQVEGLLRAYIRYTLDREPAAWKLLDNMKVS